jgi:hypothetical protein
LFPQYARLFAQTLNKSEEIPSGGTVEELSKANRQKDYKHFRQIEPEPEPEPEPRSVVSESARQEKAGIFADEVLTICIELETEDMALRGEPILPGLAKRWKAEYPSLIADAIGKGHNDTAENVAEYCHNVRTEARTGRQAQGSYAGTLPRPAQGRQLPNAPKGMEGCLVCQGQGYGIMRDDSGIQIPRKCVCVGGYWKGETTYDPTQLPTHERVSTDQSGNTYIPTPVASADPQSGARDLGDITDQLMRKYAKPIKPLPD